MRDSDQRGHPTNAAKLRINSSVNSPILSSWPCTSNFDKVCHRSCFRMVLRSSIFSRSFAQVWTGTISDHQEVEGYEDRLLRIRLQQNCKTRFCHFPNQPSPSVSSIKSPFLPKAFPIPSSLQMASTRLYSSEGQEAQIADLCILCLLGFGPIALPLHPLNERVNKLDCRIKLLN